MRRRVLLHLFPMRSKKAPRSCDYRTWVLKCTLSRKFGKIILHMSTYFWMRTKVEYNSVLVLSWFLNISDNVSTVLWVCSRHCLCSCQHTGLNVVPKVLTFNVMLWKDFHFLVPSKKLKRKKGSVVYFF